MPANNDHSLSGLWNSEVMQVKQLMADLIVCVP